MDVNQSTSSACTRRGLLAGIYVFAGLGAEELELLAERAVRKEFATREELFHQGDRSDEAYAIIRGKVKASATSADGRELTFAICKEGEIVGEVAMLAGGRRTATVTALTPLEVLVIHRRDLLDLMRRKPEIAIACMAALASRLAHVSQAMEDSLFRNLPNRLARLLVTLADEYGVDESDGTRIDLQLSQTELGNLVGATREAVNKQMRAFEQDRVLVTRDRRVWIVDRRPLEELSNSSA